MNILNVTFFNNTAHSVTTKNVAKPAWDDTIGGGNIFITDNSSLWLNNTVRIENCLIAGGVATKGGGIYLIQRVFPSVSLNHPSEVSTVVTLHILNTVEPLLKDSPN